MFNTSSAFSRPRSANHVLVVIPLKTAPAPSSALTMCEFVSVNNSSPGATNMRMANWFAKEPVGQKSAALWPNKSAIRSSSEFTVGSSP